MTDPTVLTALLECGGGYHVFTPRAGKRAGLCDCGQMDTRAGQSDTLAMRLEQRIAQIEQAVATCWCVQAGYAGGAGYCSTCSSWRGERDFLRQCLADWRREARP